MCVLKIINVQHLEHLDYEYFINKNTNNFTIKESEVKYNNDGSFNRLQITNENFDNFDFKSINKETIKNIKNQKGISYKIIETNNNVFIDKKTAYEFVYSKNSVLNNKQQKLIKSKLSKYLREIINNSTDKIYTTNKKDKHSKDAKYGFYRYKITFSILNKDVENVYEAIVLIRNSEDTKKYLYDILNIKKIN